MGVVYAARQSSIARTVALKMLKSGEGDVAQRDKFISEAVVTGELDHPNIVPIYDLGANDDGALFYSMKRVKGTPWHKVIKSRSLGENLNILLRVADAVAFAHANGVVHRDLKPENVMLGDFGEVLVMDWGLARVSAQFPSASAVTQSDAMGGTPAYMAPEMATGPLEKITPASDVYLLGAILYEIVTGKPPHTGKTVMACLFSAAKNQIASTDKTGELVEIALKAMSSRPEQRHKSVQDFQAAVKEYQAHAESLRLLGIARKNVDDAAKQGDYDLYARALYALEESLALWPGNRKAATLLEATRLDYARLALAKGDFDLGASLLDEANDDHRDVLAALASGRKERESRQRRIKFLKGAVAALAVAVVGIVSVAFVAVRGQRDVAIFERGRAEDALIKEADARELAEQETTRALEAEALAERRREAEEIARMEEENQRKIAVAAQEAEEYAAYVARIGVTKAKIDENSFERAAELLDECPAELRNWEWGRLHYLTQLAEESWRVAAPVDAVAWSPDGVHFASGDWEGNAIVWNRETGEREHTLPQGQYVHSVAFDGAGARLAAGASDGMIRIYDAATGQRLAELPGHKGGVTSVRFSPDGRRLLSCSYDKTARIWDLETNAELQALWGHTWWVCAAEFSPDGRRIVTAGQDGKAIVWEQPAGANAEAPYKELTNLTAHAGAVYMAKFSPTSDLVATAGADGRILLWNPSDVKPADIQGIIDAWSAGAASGDGQAAGRHAEGEGTGHRRPPYRELAGHRGPVRALAFAPDGKTLASGGQDNVVMIWNIADGTRAGELRGHASYVQSCDYSPDGQLLLSGGRDGQLKLWRPSTYGESRSLATDRGAARVMAARFSKDGSHIVVADKNRTASLWDVATLQRQQVFAEGHDFLASAGRFFADGSRLATAAGDGTVRIWDVGSGAELKRLDGTGRTAAVATSDDGALVATGSNGNDAQIWDAEMGELRATLTGHEAEVTALSFAPGGKLLATGDDRGDCRLWHFDEQSRQWVGGSWLRGHSRMITALAFTDGDARLITASGDNTCGQWDVAVGKELTQLVLKHPEWVSDLAVSRDGQFALTCCEDGKLRLWSLNDAREVRTLQTSGDASIFTSVDVSPDGALAVAACAAEGTVRVWSLATGEELSPAGGAQVGGAAVVAIAPWLDLGRGTGRVWAARFSPSSSHVLVIGGNDAQLLDVRSRETVTRFSPHGIVASADISPDGSRVVTGSWDRTAKIWDVATGQVLVQLADPTTGPINSVRFSPEGTRVLTACDDGTARLWSAETGELEEPVLRGHEGAVRQAVFSPDGSRILTVSDDKTARIWDAQTGEELLPLTAQHEWSVRSGAFSADGRRFITGSDDNSAIVWNAETGEEVARLAGHTAAVVSVALSPDGARVLTGSEDNAAKLWDAATGKEIITLAEHADAVTSVSFAPDGLSALTSGLDGRVLLWPAATW